MCKDTHCRCGNPYETIYCQFMARCLHCERLEEATGLPAHIGPAAPPKRPAILTPQVPA